MTEGGTKQGDSGAPPPRTPPSPATFSRASSSDGLASMDPEHEKAIKTVLHAGGFDKGAQVWVPAQSQTQAAAGWVRARLLAKEEGADGLTTFTLEELGREDGKPTGQRRMLSSKRNPSDGHYPEVHLVNEASDWEDGADLIRLPHLHEPAILHAVESRYWRDAIYSQIGGRILLAVNPFKSLSIYGPETLDRYRTAGQRAAVRLTGQEEEGESSSGGGGGEDDLASLPPHIYAVADAAYRAMTGPMAAAQGSSDQSILVSGESGAGKTESSKFIMNYLAVVATQQQQQQQQVEEEGGIASQVLQSNPILESFGNARTIRNDNSSRFGKFIELHFAAGAAAGAAAAGAVGTVGKGTLMGASIATYLLEKVRIISQAEGERNYHIFYQLLKGADAEERAALGLGEFVEEKEEGGKEGGKEEGKEGVFHYLSQSGCMSRQDGADDAEDYARTRKAMAIMGFSADEQARVMKVVAAVLHLGNLRFAVREQGGSNNSSSSSAAEGVDFSPEAASVAAASVETAERIARYLEVDPVAFQRSLTDHTIQAGREAVNVRLSPAQAKGAREALAKAIYGNLFLWIVNRVNAAIHTHGRQEEKEESSSLPSSSSSSSSRSFIGILDIFGFEIMQRNSFEQLCINAANEQLQQQFNQFVFRLEQEEYEREDISWSFVSFPDNQECLDLIEKRGTGIWAVLDEQCVVPKASDSSFAHRLYDVCKGHPRFAVTSRDRVDCRFRVRHYAGEVVYDTGGFLEKNKDQLYQETVDLLRSSRCGLVQSLSSDAKAVGPTTTSSSDAPSSSSSPAATATKRRSAVAPLTVASQFKGQLALLLQRIHSTRPHYVRCLKPNDKNVASAFDEPRVIEQLRCGGVLEAVRVSRAGYPTRLVHAQFNQRYRPLALDGYHKARRKAKAAAAAALVSGAAVVPVGDGGALHHQQQQQQEEMDRRLAEAVIRELADILWRKRREEGSLVVPLPSEAARAALPLKEVLAHVGLQLGRTKVFFRLQAFEELETMRGRLLQVMAIKVQSFIRAWTRQRAYRRLRCATLVAQQLVRGFLARREVQQMRMERAATTIQAAVRQQQARRRFVVARAVVVTLQCLWREQRARRQLQQLRRFRAAVRVQAWVRMRQAQWELGRKQAGILSLQCFGRVLLAQRVLRRLRVEEKNLRKIVQERNELRELLRGVQAELGKVTRERDRLREGLEEERVKRGEVEERVLALESELQASVARVAAAKEETAAVIAAAELQKQQQQEEMAKATRMQTQMIQDTEEVAILRARILELEAAVALGAAAGVTAVAAGAATMGGGGGDLSLGGSRQTSTDTGGEDGEEENSSSSSGAAPFLASTGGSYYSAVSELDNVETSSSSSSSSNSLTNKTLASASSALSMLNGGGDLGENQALGVEGGEEAEVNAVTPASMTRTGSATAAAASPQATAKPSSPSLSSSLASPTPPPTPISSLRPPLAATPPSTPQSSTTTPVQNKPSSDLAHFLLTHAGAGETDELLATLQSRLEKESAPARQEALKATSVDGRTPLHLAAMAGSARVVELLLTHGAVANALSQDETPLHLSSNDGVTRALLANGADPSIPHKQTKEVALHIAIRNRDILSLQALLERPRHRRSINERDENWTTPLHLACRVGLLDAVVLLCDHEAFKEAADKEGLRPLHVICSSPLDHLSAAAGPGIIKHLLEAGADGAGRTAQGWTPLHLLCENKEGFVSFPEQVCEMATLLMEKGGVAQDVVGVDGVTPLLLATRNDLGGLCELLRERGARSLSKEEVFRVRRQQGEGRNEGGEGEEGGGGAEEGVEGGEGEGEGAVEEKKKRRKRKKDKKKKKSVVVAEGEEKGEGEGAAIVGAAVAVEAAAEAEARNEEGSEGTGGGGEGGEGEAGPTKKKRKNQTKNKNKNRREKKKAAAEAEAAAAKEGGGEAAVMPLTTKKEEEVEALPSVVVEEPVASSAVNVEKQEEEEEEEEGAVTPVPVEPAAVAPVEETKEEEEQGEAVAAEGGGEGGAEVVSNDAPNDDMSTPAKKQRKRNKKKNTAAAAAKTANGATEGEQEGEEAATPTTPN